MRLWLTNNTLTVSSPDPLDTDILKECIMKTSSDPKKLLDFFQIVEHLHKKADQGDHTQ